MPASVSANRKLACFGLDPSKEIRAACAGNVQTLAMCRCGRCIVDIGRSPPAVSHPHGLKCLHNTISTLPKPSGDKHHGASGVKAHQHDRRVVPVKVLCFPQKRSLMYLVSGGFCWRLIPTVLLMAQHLTRHQCSLPFDSFIARWNHSRLVLGSQLLDWHWSPTCATGSKKRAEVIVLHHLATSGSVTCFVWCPHVDTFVEVRMWLIKHAFL